MIKNYLFSQVDVFTHQPLLGNPLAVVHSADDLSDHRMAQFANWTNLSETTFLLNPVNPLADYRVRIFTPSTELPFAGHPTLGSCYAWLANGGTPKSSDFIIQECEIGLIKIRRDKDLLSFAAPPLIRTGPLDGSTLVKLADALGVNEADITAHQWVDNGPGWCAVMLKTAELVLSIKPDASKLKEFKLGVIGPYPSGGECDYEVRAFVVPFGITEDPVTGSLNAGIASWMTNSGLSKDNYTVSQGTALGRQGRVYIQKAAGDVWVGGHVAACVKGSVSI